MSILESLPPVPTVADRLRNLKLAVKPSLPRPPLEPSSGTNKVFLGIESFRRHMSDEGWQLQAGLMEAGGYQLWGKSLPNSSVDVPHILSVTKPNTVILQDRREWHSANPACISKGEDFVRHEELGRHPEIFKLTVLKDSQHDSGDCRQTAINCGLHAWITYYNSDMVAALAPYARKEHLIRTYHSVDITALPEFDVRSKPCLLSGALASDIYPLRHRLFHDRLRGVTNLNHPGYHAKGTRTREFLKLMSSFKVAICTCSIYAYALRKIIEGTACGCRVITDLPPDEVLPEIDGNLVRVPPTITKQQMEQLIDELVDGWDYVVQQQYAMRARLFYDYHATTKRLSDDITSLRRQMLCESHA